MSNELPTQRVEVRFVGPSPAAGRMAQASGVTAVEVDGSLLRCVVCGSFQPFLEALRGFEVIGLSAVPAHGDAGSDHQPAVGEDLGLQRGGG